MLYSYKIMNEKYDEAIVKTSHDNITEQLFYKNNNLVKHELIGWRVEYGRISYCECTSGDLVIIPPTINKVPIECIGADAFSGNKPDTLILLPKGRVTLEVGSVSDIATVISYSWLKRSQITSNIKIYGKVLEDV